MSDDFGDYRQQRNASSIHIHIDETPTASIPANSASNETNSFHSMLNRQISHNLSQLRQHTNLNINLRSLISNSNQTFRYTPLINPNSVTNHNTADNVHILFNDEQRANEQIENPSSIRRSRLETNTTRTDGNVVANEAAANENDGHVTIDQMRQQARLEEDNNNNNNNVFSDLLVRFLGNFIRYLPFLIILFVKFIHDHLLGILDIAILQIVMWFVNKSLNQQVSKLSQKNILILTRDMGLILATVTYRFLLSPESPDPFGLIINPPSETLTIEVSSNASASNMEQSTALLLLKKFLTAPNMPMTDAGSALYVTKAISLGLLLYYVVVNDLILKLLTIWIKILITMLPSRLLRHNQRARLYVLVEYFSQLYRSIVPMKQWGKFLFKSYTGLEVISGILLSAFYMGAKGLEFASRGKVLHQAFMNFLRNMDYERKPTKAELDSAGQICPICHDTYNTPVILTCNHIFCDDCVGQWFKREQTCPMCRAKVSEDPLWQDGSTTFFYQLC